MMNVPFFVVLLLIQTSTAWFYSSNSACNFVEVDEDEEQKMKDMIESEVNYLDDYNYDSNSGNGSSQDIHSINNLSSNNNNSVSSSLSRNFSVHVRKHIFNRKYSSSCLSSSSLRSLSRSNSLCSISSTSGSISRSNSISSINSHLQYDSNTINNTNRSLVHSTSIGSLSSIISSDDIFEDCDNSTDSCADTSINTSIDSIDCLNNYSFNTSPNNTSILEDITIKKSHLIFEIPEIISKIISFSAPIHNCLFVNKKWHHLTKEILYREIYLNSFSIENFSSANFLKLSSKVQKLSLKNIRQYQLQKLCTKIKKDTFDNLKTLEISSSDITHIPSSLIKSTITSLTIKAPNISSNSLLSIFKNAAQVSSIDLSSTCISDNTLVQLSGVSSIRAGLRTLKLNYCQKTIHRSTLLEMISSRVFPNLELLEVQGFRFRGDSEISKLVDFTSLYNNCAERKVIIDSDIAKKVKHLKFERDKIVVWNVFADLVEWCNADDDMDYRVVF